MKFGCAFAFVDKEVGEQTGVPFAQQIGKLAHSYQVIQSDLFVP